MVIHAFVFVTPHEQPASVSTPMPPLSATARCTPLLTSSEREHSSPGSCVMVKICPATLTVPVRESTEMFVETL